MLSVEGRGNKQRRVTGEKARDTERRSKDERREEWREIRIPLDIRHPPLITRSASVVVPKSVESFRRHSGQAGDSVGGRISLRLKLERSGIQKIQKLLDTFWFQSTSLASYARALPPRADNLVFPGRLRCCIFKSLHREDHLCLCESYLQA